MSEFLPTVEEIILAIQQDRPASAEQLARRYLGTSVPDESVLTLLGLSLQQQGKSVDAANTFTELTRLWPQTAEHWNNLATVLRQIGELDRAENAYRRSLALNPRDGFTFENLGFLYYERADFASARSAFLSACEANPELTSARVFGAYACCECTDMESAERLVASWQQWPPIDLNHHLLLAAVMTRIGNLAGAEAILLRSLQQTTEKTRVQVRLIMLYERLNRVEEAQSLLAQLQRPETISDPELQSEIANAYAALAARENDFQKARNLLEPLANIGRPDADFFFALARIRDKDNDADAAMAALHEAHAGQLRKAAFLVPDLIASGVEPLTAGLDSVTAETRRQWLEMPTPSMTDSPIFIMGFPRSGTTMLEQMLDALPALQAMDEQPFFQNVVERMQTFGLTYPQDLHRLDALQCDELRKVYWDLVNKTVKLDPGQRLVDKNPLNMLRLPLINRLFPEARIIFALRHPCDVVLSCYMQSFGSPSFMLLCSTLERLARGYSNAMHGWLQNAKILSPAIMQLRHEDLLDDFAARAQAIADFIGIADASPMLAFHEHARKKGYIATPSYAQVTEPMNRRGVNRWHRYRRHLEPILPVLRPLMEQWGYAD